MGILGDALARLSAFAIHVLETTGYAGLLLLMAAESMVFPVPSEAVMPVAGALIVQGKMTWFGAIAASTAGSALGSYLSYLIGRHGMLPVVAKWGRFVFVKGHHITKAQGYFARRGAVAVFVCRFIPGVRHVSSIPAGAAKMPLAPFMVASVVGATIWNTVLLWFGWKFAGNDSAVAAVKHNLDLVGAGLLLLLVAYIWYEVRAAKKAKQEEPTPRS